MITEIEPTTELWDAWIDLQCPGKNGVATLFVIGDIIIRKNQPQPRLTKRTTQPEATQELILEINPDALFEEGLVSEILYSEDLHDLKQYTAISIYAGAQLIARIENIELFF